MPATLKDIAERVGLSQVAVSQVIRGTGSISPTTRERVLAVAKEMRYRPHGIARSMRRGRTGLVGLIYGTANTLGNLPMAQLSGIQCGLSDGSFDLLLAEVADSALSVPAQTAASLLRQWMADGLLVNHQLHLPAQVAELVEEAHVPAVWMNSRLMHNCVHFDEEAAGLAAARHLLSVGHRAIVYLDPSHGRASLSVPKHHSVVDRLHGYERAMSEVGLAPRSVMPDDAPVDCEDRAAFCRRWLTRPDRPTAVVAHSSRVVGPLVHAAVTLGLSVPRDLSVITFGTPNEYVGLDGGVTTQVQDFHALGRASAELLMARIAQEAAGQAVGSLVDPLVIPMPRHDAASVAPPRPS